MLTALPAGITTFSTANQLIENVDFLGVDPTPPATIPATPVVLQASRIRVTASGVIFRNCSFRYASLIVEGSGFSGDNLRWDDAPHPRTATNWTLVAETAAVVFRRANLAHLSRYYIGSLSTAIDTEHGIQVESGTNLVIEDGIGRGQGSVGVGVNLLQGEHVRLINLDLDAYPGGAIVFGTVGTYSVDMICDGSILGGSPLTCQINSDDCGVRGTTFRGATTDLAKHSSVNFGVNYSNRRFDGTAIVSAVPVVDYVGDLVLTPPDDALTLNMGDASLAKTSGGSFPGFATLVRNVHPDNWQTRASLTATHGGTFFDVWPFGRSTQAKTTPPAQAIHGNVSITSASSAASIGTGWTKGTEGAITVFTAPSDLVIYGKLTITSSPTNRVGLRARRLIVANPWFDPTLAGQSGRQLTDVPNFPDMNGDSAIINVPDAALDIEDFLLLGSGGTTNQFGYAHSIASSASSGSFTITCNYLLGDANGNVTGNNSITSSPIPLPLTKNGIETGLNSITTIMSQAANRSAGQNLGTHVNTNPAFGVYIRGNGSFVIDQNDQLTLQNAQTAHNSGLVSSSGTVLIDTVRANTCNQGQISVGGAINLPRAVGDTKNYPTGIQQFCVIWRMADLIKGEPNELTVWHGTDAGVHPVRVNTFGGSHMDCWQFTQGGNNTTHLPIFRFVMATTGSGGIFMSDKDSGTVPIDWAIGSECLWRGRGSGSHIIFMTTKAGSGVTNSGSVDSAFDQFTRDEVDESWNSPHQAPHYVDTSIGPTTELIWDGNTLMPGYVALTAAAAGATGVTILPRPTGINWPLPTPIDPG